MDEFDLQGEFEKMNDRVKLARECLADGMAVRADRQLDALYKDLVRIYQHLTENWPNNKPQMVRKP